MHVRTTVFALTMAVSLVCAGCTSGGGHQPRKSSGGPGSSAGRPAATDPRTRAVIKAYEGYWPALLKASDPPTPQSPALLTYVTGAELGRARDVLKARMRAGEGLTGHYAHHDTVVRLASQTASLTDCLTTSTTVVDLKTRRTKATSPRGPFPVAVTMSKVSGSWRVADIESASFACPPRPLLSAPATTKRK
jgi:hypothetical protein